MEKVFIGTVALAVVGGLLHTWAYILGIDPAWMDMGLLALFTWAGLKKLMAIVL